MIYGWIWIGILIASIVIEALTDQMVSIWFAPSSVVAVILDFCGVRIYWQIVVFLLISVVGIVFAKIFLPKISPASSKDSKTNIEAIIGEKCVVTEKIDNYSSCGQARVKGQIWSARSVNDDEIFEIGETLRVVAIEGVKLICKKM